MHSDIAKTLNNIGNLYQAQKDYPTAIKYYQESLSIKETLSDTEGQAVTHNNLSELYYLAGDYQAALHNAQASLAFSRKLNHHNLLLNNYRQLAKIQAALQNYKSAWEAQQQYISLSDELYKAESRNVLAEMLARYETEERTKEIHQLRTEQNVQRQKLSQQIHAKLRLIYMIFVISLVAFIIFLLYYQKRREVKKRKAVQAELEVLNRHLERRVEEEMDKYHQQQQIIVQKSKLEALGNLAAGIAHEINQPLSALAMSLDNIQNKAEKGAANPEYLNRKLDNMQNDIRRIRQIIEHVRLFSRDQKNGALESLNLNETIRGAIELLQHELNKHDIRLSLQLTPQPVFTIGNRFKLEQVLLNLLSNARDAVLDKANQGLYHEEKKTIALITSLQDSQVAITVRDNGIGIPQVLVDKVFDPFFTTKNPDKGTGLGLSISFGIIQEMQGSIQVQSAPGIGTGITVTLPLIRSSNATT